MNLFNTISKLILLVFIVVLIYFNIYIIKMNILSNEYIFPVLIITVLIFVISLIIIINKRLVILKLVTNLILTFLISLFLLGMIEINKMDYFTNEFVIENGN